jgi:hypothetical protein
MNGERELMRRVQLGIDVESFLQGPIGQHLLMRLKEEADEAAQQLKTVDPCSYSEIVKLQMTVRRAENIEGWLAGLIQEGWHAEQQLKGEEM